MNTKNIFFESISNLGLTNTQLRAVSSLYSVCFEGIDEDDSYEDDYGLIDTEYDLMIEYENECADKWMDKIQKGLESSGMSPDEASTFIEEKELYIIQKMPDIGRMIGNENLMNSSADEVVKCILDGSIDNEDNEGVVKKILSDKLSKLGYGPYPADVIIKDYSKVIEKYWECGSSVLADVIHKCTPKYRGEALKQYPLDSIKATLMLEGKSEAEADDIIETHSEYIKQNLKYGKEMRSVGRWMFPIGTPIDNRVELALTLLKK